MLDKTCDVIPSNEAVSSTTRVLDIVVTSDGTTDDIGAAETSVGANITWLLSMSGCVVVGTTAIVVTSSIKPISSPAAL